MKINRTKLDVFYFLWIGFVISLSLGFGFYTMGGGLWLLPVILMAIVSWVGPFVYLFIREKLERKIFREQGIYHTDLRRASLAMGRIKDLKRLLDLIVYVVMRTVKTEHASIYLYHQESNQFTLKASKGKKHNGQSILASSSDLIQYLKRTNESINYEKVKRYVMDNPSEELSAIVDEVEGLHGALVVPSFIEERLLAVIVLGKKRSKQIYTDDDIVVFSILANQSALSIENAQFYEDMKKTHKQLFEAEKMATIGTMADGLSHQINNRLHAIGFIVSDALDTIARQSKKVVDDVAISVIEEMRYAFEKISDNVDRGRDIVGGLLKYTRTGSSGFEAIGFDQLLTESVEMVGLKVKLNEFDIVRNYDSNLPKIKGNFTQIQEVFLNIIDNAYDAIIQRKMELKEKDYRGQLIFTVQRLGRKIEILIHDNGIGVKDKDNAKLFTPFFTTKHSRTKKGTGLGLYVIRQLIENNHGGTVEFSGVYRKGSTTRIVLPTASK